MRVYKIKDSIDLIELEKYGYKYDYDEEVNKYVREVYSSKTKGKFTPYIKTGYSLIGKDKIFYDILIECYRGAKKEHKEALDEIYKILIKDGLAEEVYIHD